MEKLKFSFLVKGTQQGKSNFIALTQIETPDGEKFEIPEEYQPMEKHTILEKTKEFVKLKGTLTKRHQKRNVWVLLTPELTDCYIDEAGNMIFGDQFLEQIQENLEPEDGSLKDLLKQLIEDKKKNTTENLTKKAEKFVIEKFSNKNSNARQWIQEFETECRRLEVKEKQMIEMFKLFLDRSCIDWYASMMLKLTIDSNWSEWKNNFCETYGSKGWAPVRYALAYKYQTGSLVDFAVKKERLILEVRKTTDTGMLIDLITTALPNFVTDKLDRESLKKTENLFNALGKLEHLADKKKVGERKVETQKAKTPEKYPCRICEKHNKPGRYHPESNCWILKNKENGENKNEKIKHVNNAEIEVVLEQDNPKN